MDTARAVILVIVCALAGWWLPTDVQAHTRQCGASNPAVCDKGEAYAAANNAAIALAHCQTLGNGGTAFVSATKTNGPNLGPSGVFWDVYYGCNHPTGQYRTYNELFYFNQCPTDRPWNETTKTCQQVCDPAGPALEGGFMKYTGDEPGYQTCNEGCEYNPSSMTYKTGTVDGIKFVSLQGWIPSGASCTVGPNDGFIPPSDTDKDGVSDGNDSAPNNPGESSPPDDPDGEGPREGPDGEDGEEGDGSGNGNQSSGGGDCSAPPNSNGDAILGMIAFQAWRAACAIEGLKDKNGNVRTTGSGAGTGGDDEGDNATGAASNTCDTQPSCSVGDGVICAVLRQEWFNACRMVDDIEASADATENKAAADEFLQQVLGEEETAGVEEEDSSELLDLVEMDGFGGRGSCPINETFSVFGRTYTVNCDNLGPLLDAMAALVLLLMAYHSGVILLGGRV